MKIKNIKKGFMFFCIGFITVLLVSCDRKDNVPMIGNGLIPDILSTEYNLDDIIIDIYIGIGGENSEFPENYKYQIAITNNIEDAFGVGDDLIVLLEIESDPVGKYNYTINKDGEAVYTYLERFTLPSEVFSDTSGFFYIGMLEININPDKSESIAGMSRYKYSYVVVNHKVTMTIIQ